MSGKQVEGQSEQHHLHSEDWAAQWMSTRTALSHAHFFLSALKRGMSILDCGCGPGTITTGLAEFVSPGRVIGIDIDANRIRLAEAHAADQNIANVHFQTGDVYELAFPDNSFDGVFAHAFLELLRDPVKAIKEMYRVLKPSRTIALSEGDLDSQIYAPSLPLLERFWQLYQRLARARGMEPCFGKRLKSLLRESGFVHIEAKASAEVFGTPESTEAWGHAWSRHIREDWIAGGLIERGWVTRSEIQDMSEAWKQWSKHPDAFFVRTWCEVIGWKRE